jgi:Prolyl oligopeptidase family
VVQQHSPLLGAVEGLVCAARGRSGQGGGVFEIAFAPVFCGSHQGTAADRAGANDVRVKQAESDQIVDAMRQANKSVEYVVYTDEGHGLARPENRLHFFAKAEEFLAKYLGGRFEPVGDLKGHAGVLK